MIDQGSQAGMPVFTGPSASERFCDDMAAVRALMRHDLPRPPQLELAAITARYPAVDIGADEDGLPEYIEFVDRTAAQRTGRRWEVLR